jgi:hypothetical protein
MVLTSSESAYLVRAQIHNSALPSANSNLITNIDGPSSTTTGAVRFQVYWSVSVTTGNFVLKRTRSAATSTELIGANPTTANQIINFDNIIVDQGETINFQCTVTTGTINKLFVIEKQL